MEPSEIDIKRVADVLSRVAQGTLPARTRHDGLVHWTVEAGGLTIVIFDDAHEVDYVEHARDRATGEVMRFNDFMDEYGRDPVDLLSAEDKRRLQERMNGDAINVAIPPPSRSKRRR